MTFASRQSSESQAAAFPCFQRAEQENPGGRMKQRLNMAFETFLTAKAGAQSVNQGICLVRLGSLSRPCHPVHTEVEVGCISCSADQEPSLGDQSTCLFLVFTAIEWGCLSYFFRDFDKIPCQKQCKRESVYFDHTSGFHSAIVGKKWAGAWGCWLHGIKSRSKAKWIQAAAPSPLLQVYSPGPKPRNDSTHSGHIIPPRLNVMKIIHRHVQRPS